MNVTPLVDVVLVLLIIFMVIIPQMQAGAPVNVPGIANPDQAPDASHPPITLSVTKGGRLFLEKAEVAREDLLATALCTEMCDTLLGEGVPALHFYTLNRASLTRDVCYALGVTPAVALQHVA